MWWVVQSRIQPSGAIGLKALIINTDATFEVMGCFLLGGIVHFDLRSTAEARMAPNSVSWFVWTGRRPESVLINY